MSQKPFRSDRASRKPGASVSRSVWLGGGVRAGDAKVQTPSVLPPAQRRLAESGKPVRPQFITASQAVRTDTRPRRVPSSPIHLVNKIHGLVSPTIFSSSNRLLLQPRVCRIDRPNEHRDRSLASRVLPIFSFFESNGSKGLNSCFFIIDRQVQPTDLIFDCHTDREFCSMKRSRSAVDRSILGRTCGG